MTNRELFLAAFDGCATERVPLYEQAFASDVASEILGRPAYTGASLLHWQEAVASVRGDAAYAEFREQVRRDTIDLHRALGFGAVCEPWLRGRPTRQVGEYDYLYGDPEGEWVVYRYDPTARTYGPLRYAHAPEWRGEEAIRAAVEEMERWAERWREYGRPGHQAHLQTWKEATGEEFELLGGAGLAVPLNEEWLTACALCPDLVAAYLDAQVEVGLQQMAAQAEVGLTIAWGGGDLADNRGPVYGPRFFCEVVAPRYRRLAEGAHAAGMKYVFRSDGDLWPIADVLFGETGVDGYGEIDFDAGMRIADLQERFPTLTCWGNVPARLLRDGPLDAIRTCAESIVAAGQPRGRLILGSGNTVLPGTPVENYLALMEAARQN